MRHLRSIFRAAPWSKCEKKQRNAAEFLGSILHRANSFSWHCNALQIVNMRQGGHPVLKCY